MNGRDIHDWPALATALLFNCPIWTEDKDFFGVGIPVWTTDRIHLFFDALNFSFGEKIKIQEQDTKYIINSNV